MPTARIGVIGGSGLYQMEGLTGVEEAKLDTPFGPPSDVITIGTLDGRRVAFLPRHGRGHRVSPSELPARANIYAMKLLGVERIISVSACGSMREDIAPLDVVIPNQIFDRTKGIRPATFFGDGLVAHISFADPFCADMSRALYDAASEAGARAHQGGTLIVIEGPQFSTKAESRIYRQWGVDIIGMTALPEAKLAREAEICYATLAMVTDYDVWHISAEPVTVEMVVRNLQKNVRTAQRIIRAALARIDTTRACECATALRDAMITQRAAANPAQFERLRPLLAKYIS